MIHPFDRAKFRLSTRSGKARLRVNLEPFDDTQGLELVERQA
jgi:hypothetical protein